MDRPGVIHSGDEVALDEQVHDLGRLAAGDAADQARRVGAAAFEGGDDLVSPDRHAIAEIERHRVTARGSEEAFPLRRSPDGFRPTPRVVDTCADRALVQFGEGVDRVPDDRLPRAAEEVRQIGDPTPGLGVDAYRELLTRAPPSVDCRSCGLSFGPSTPRYEGPLGVWRHVSTSS